jgi:hypothetical protein
MFDVGRPVQAYADGGAAFPDLSGDGKITQKDILIGRGVIEKQYGGPIGMEEGGVPFIEYEQPIDRALGLTSENLPERRIERGLIETMGETRFFKLPPETQMSLLSTLGNSTRDQATLLRLKGMMPELSTMQIGYEEQKRLDDLTRSGDFREGPVKGMLPPSDDPRMEKFGPQERDMISERFRQNKSDGKRRVIKGLQMGGDPMTAPPMPMPAPEQPPMPMQDQLDPNVVQNALAQAAGGIGDLDQAQNYEQVMNTMRGDQATVEERREELAGVVGPGDANQTPESVLTLVQPVMMLANVDQGIGQLAQQEMTQPMEGPMAGGIMSTVPEPPMMEAGGTAPVNFNKGGEVRPVQYFAPINTNRVAGLGNFRLGQLGVDLSQPFKGTVVDLAAKEAIAQEEAAPGTGRNRLKQILDEKYALYSQFGADPDAAQKQKNLTKAQMLFDIAKTALAFAAPMPGERPGLSPAERLAMAATTTQLPDRISARAQTQLEAEKAADKEKRALGLAALQSAETQLRDEQKTAAALKSQKLKAEAEAKAADVKYIRERSMETLKSKLKREETEAGAAVDLTNRKVIEKLLQENRIDLENLKLKKGQINAKELLELEQKFTKKQNDLEFFRNRANIRLNSKLASDRLGIQHTNELEKQKKGFEHAEKIVGLNQQFTELQNNLDREIDKIKISLDRAQGQEKQALQEKLYDLEKRKTDAELASTNLIDYSIGQKQSFSKFLTEIGEGKGLDLALSYGLGQTNPAQNNAIHFVINNFTKDTLSDIDGAVVPGGSLPTEWENAIAQRQTLNAGLPEGQRYTLPEGYTGGGTQDGAFSPTPNLDNAIDQVQTRNDIDDVTYDKLINEIDTLKGVGTPAALGQLVNKTSELLSFMISKPFPNVAKAVNLLEGFNLNAELVIMSSVKGKTDQDMRKRIEARLPQPAQFFAGKEDALDKIKLTEAFFNQEINSIRVQLSRPLKFTRKTELTSDLAKFTAVRDGYTALRKSFERRFKQIDVGGRPQDVDVNEFINVTPER